VREELLQLKEMLAQPHNRLWQDQLPLEWWEEFVSSTHPSLVEVLERSGVFDSVVFRTQADAIKMNCRKLESLVGSAREALSRQSHPDPLIQERIAETLAALVGILNRILEDTDLNLI
jgi:hypothetical protein